MPTTARGVACAGAGPTTPDADAEARTWSALVSVSAMAPMLAAEARPTWHLADLGVSEPQNLDPGHRRPDHVVSNIRGPAISTAQLLPNGSPTSIADTYRR